MANWGIEKILQVLKSTLLTIIKLSTKISYWPCLLICVIGILFYLVGIKKGGKIAIGSLLTYTLLQALKVAIK